MATLSELRAAVETLLGLPGISAALQLNSNTRERAFEAYVLSLVATAIRNAGGTAVVHGRVSGEHPTSVVLRGAPGMMGSSAQDYAFVKCVLGEKKFEIHVDVQFEGTSGAIHEIDVSVYEEASAAQVRAVPTAYPKTAKLYGALECKFYDSALRVSLGRTFVGLLDDCGDLRVRAFASNGQSKELAQYFTPKGRPDRFFQLSPLHPDSENDFVTAIKQQLSKWTGVL